MAQGSADLIRTTIVMPLLHELMEASTEAESAMVGMRIQRGIVHSDLREAVYVFVFDSWDAMHSMLRMGEQYGLADFGEYPEPMQRAVGTIGKIWADLFVAHPYDMSAAYFQILDKSDEPARRRLAWISLPISGYLGRDVMAIVQEQLTRRR